jgi:hypothetical protein
MEMTSLFEFSSLLNDVMNRKSAYVAHHVFGHLSIPLVAFRSLVLTSCGLPLCLFDLINGYLLDFDFKAPTTIEYEIMYPFENLEITWRSDSLQAEFGICLDIMRRKPRLEVNDTQRHPLWPPMLMKSGEMGARSNYKDMEEMAIYQSFYKHKTGRCIAAKEIHTGWNCEIMKDQIKTSKKGYQKERLWKIVSESRLLECCRITENLLRLLSWILESRGLSFDF